MKVFLVGYMGSGKTTAGRILAKMMDIPFRDLDLEIVNNEKLSVGDIFKSMGESAFRGMERQTLKELTATSESFLLGCGGGTPCFYDNMADMNAAGVTVYLQMDAASLAYRLIHAKEQRPLLHGMGEEEVKSFVKQHLEERESYYKEADLTINAFGLDKRKLEPLIGEIRSVYANKNISN